MLEEIRTRQAIAFVGAGVSRPLGYPTWRALIQRLADETRARCGEAIVSDQGRNLTVTEVTLIDNLLIQAEIFKCNLEARYYEIIQETFAPRGANADIRDLVSLPFQHLLTSNYDLALESAHDELQSRYESISLCERAVGQFINNLGMYNYPRYVVHVHGRFDDPQNIVLTEKEYADFYQRSPEAQAFWNIVPIVRRCIFFGFSFTDQELTEGFNLRNFNRAQRGNRQVVHFGLVPIGDPEQEAALRAQYNASYGIDPVFFDGVDKKFSGYSVLIHEIAKEFEDRIVPPPIGLAEIIAPEIAVPAEAPEATGEQQPTPYIQQDLARLEQLTEDNIKRRSTGDLE